MKLKERELRWPCDQARRAISSCIQVGLFPGNQALQLSGPWPNRPLSLIHFAWRRLPPPPLAQHQHHHHLSSPFVHLSGHLLVPSLHSQTSPTSTLKQSQRLLSLLNISPSADNNPQTSSTCPMVSEIPPFQASTPISSSSPTKDPTRCSALTSKRARAKGIQTKADPLPPVPGGQRLPLTLRIRVLPHPRRRPIARRRR